MKLFSFIYFLDEDVEKTKQVLGEHVTYWKKKDLKYFRNGPFADKSGGLIIFSATDEGEAAKMVAVDPLLKGGAVRQHWLKEWIN
jgi:uncharacterized protein YciI